MSTIFHKIIAREIPAEIVYEDEHTLSFLDINPVNKGHALVIPKEPSESIFDISEASFVRVAQTARRIANVMKEAVGADGVNIIVNNGSAAGQEIPYLHMHVIPRFADDHALSPAQHVTYEDGELSIFAAKIQNALG
ncbi:HIT family protein [Candidatus Kaiserbacteria bacterium]|nr:HIT family protein [Candidatus Kaiserbacteria bacterium]